MKSVGASGLSRKLLLYAVMCAKHMFNDYIKYEHDVKSNGLMQLGCANQPSAKKYFDAIDFLFYVIEDRKEQTKAYAILQRVKKKLTLSSEKKRRK